MKPTLTFTAAVTCLFLAAVLSLLPSCVTNKVTGKREWVGPAMKLSVGYQAISVGITVFSTAQAVAESTDKLNKVIATK